MSPNKQGAQAFTGAPTTCPDTYPHVNAAFDLADKIGVTKNGLNLKQLENITEHTYSDTVASTSKIVEVDESPKLLERFTSLKLSDKEAKANCQEKSVASFNLKRSLLRVWIKARVTQYPPLMFHNAWNCRG